MRALAAAALLASSLACLAKAQKVALLDPPSEIVLNDRKHPIQVQYSGVGGGQFDLHVDLVGDGGYTWFGGGSMTVQGPSGVAKVPIEIRVPPYYSAPLLLSAYVSPLGKAFDAKLAVAPEAFVTVSKTPVDAIGILCQPKVVAPGKPFSLNLWFTQTHARESDIIAVALNDATKEYWGGFTVPVKEQQGYVSAQFNLKPGPSNLPLKFKAWISPRGEGAPNYVSYTMINMGVGPNTVQDCNAQGNSEWTPAGLPPANWVELRSVPKEFAPGSALTIPLGYNLAGLPEASVSLSLMTWDWQTHASDFIAGAVGTIKAGQSSTELTLIVPPAARPGRDGVYFVAYFTPVDGTYEQSLAEDRVYNTKMTTAAAAAEVAAGGAASLLRGKN